MNRVDYRGDFWFPVPPDRLWTMIERFDLFESWWRPSLTRYHTGNKLVRPRAEASAAS